MQYKLINNEAQSQFEFDLPNGEKAVVVYQLDPQNKTLYLTHTGVPEDYRNQGIADQLVKDVLDTCQQEDYSVVPVCPFVAAYIKRHPQYMSLVFRGSIFDSL